MMLQVSQETFVVESGLNAQGNFITVFGLIYM